MSFEKKKILVVDDEPAITRLMKLNLEATNDYVVRTVNVATAARAAAVEFRPDLIFLDIVMPEMEGSWVAAAIREVPSLKDVPIVYLTAVVTSDEVRSHDGRIGGDEYVEKPVAIARILECLERHFPTVAHHGACLR